MQHTCNMRGVCSRTVTFHLDDEGVVRDIVFKGGCSGNLQGVAALAGGRTADELVATLKGIRCGFKNTSCPDQFAKALEEIAQKRYTKNDT